MGPRSESLLSWCLQKCPLSLAARAKSLCSSKRTCGPFWCAREPRSLWYWPPLGAVRAGSGRCDSVWPCRLPCCSYCSGAFHGLRRSESFWDQVCRQYHSSLYKSSPSSGPFAQWTVESPPVCAPCFRWKSVEAQSISCLEYLPCKSHRFL